jgi:polyhydroxyalkanoate synthesis regulator protein
MIAFARNQEQMRKNLQATFGIFPFGPLEEVGKQNIALFERALKMLAPYGREEQPPSPEAEGEAKKAESEDPRLKRLEAQIDTLTRQLEELGRDRENR